MADPKLRFEGNLRFASIGHDGCPLNAQDLWQDIVSTLVEKADTAVECYGPPVILFTLPADDEPISNWPCQVGTAITGLTTQQPPLFIEDYRNLYSLSAPHMDALADLHLTYKQLANHARALGYSLRPYWRLSLRRTRLADGGILPAAEVSVFVDR